MSVLEFGEFVDETSNKEKEFGEFVSSDENNQVGNLRSLAGAPVKGALKETFSFIDFLNKGGLADPGPIPKEMRGKIIEKLFPTKKRGFEEALERGGELMASAALTGPSALKRVPAALGLGQLLKFMGAPESVQNIGEMVAFSAPGLGAQKGKIVPKKSQKEVVDFLRAKGFTEKEIVPLIKKDTFINRALDKLSYKGKSQAVLGKQIQEKLGKQYDYLKVVGEDKLLPNKFVTKVDDSFSDIYEKLSPDYQKMIGENLRELRSRGFTQKNLIDFYQDVSRKTKGIQGGKAVLNLFKNPTTKALGHIDAGDAKTFSYVNQFYSKNKQFLKNITPGALEKAMSIGKMTVAFAPMLMGDFSFLAKVIGTHAAQLALREFSRNPRLQNLSSQMLKAMSQNQTTLYRKLYKSIETELSKKVPEAKKIFRSQEEVESP